MNHALWAAAMLDNSNKDLEILNLEQKIDRTEHENDELKTKLRKAYAIIKHVTKHDPEIDGIDSVYNKVFKL